MTHDAKAQTREVFTRGLTRRQFNKALGALALSSPFLPQNAYGQDAGVAKRLVIFFTPNGSIHAHWKPQGMDRMFSFAPGSILEPLERHRSQMLVLDGIDFYGVSNHEGGMAAMLTGGASSSSATNGMSVDQYVAQAIGQDSRFRSLELGVQTSAWGGNVQTRMCYRSSSEYAPPDDSPLSVYRRIFGDITGSMSDIDRLAARRRSILDLTRTELNAMHNRVGARQAAKLDQHLESIRALERRLTGTTTAACTPPEAISELDIYANQNFPFVGEAQMDLMIAALACDVTRVATLQWSHTVGPTVFSWLGLEDGHHSLSHYDPSNPEAISDFIASERWYSERFADLLDRLAALPEPGGEGSMLDHSLVVWAQELGDGRLHECKRVPFILAGAAGGHLRPGAYIDYGTVPHQKLLVSICQACGLTNQVYGDASHGTGGLEGLT